MLLHVIFLMIHFRLPDFSQDKFKEPDLEIILTQTKQSAAPEHAAALAQNNFNGSQEVEDAPAEVPAEKQKKQKKFQVLAPKINTAPRTTTSPIAPNTAALKEMTDIETEINKNIEHINNRPNYKKITPSTREVGYAMYYKALQERIEKIGTFNFPSRNGKRMYGELIVSIPIFQDGTIFNKNGGARIERSSGNPDLDHAALAIVERSAPFGRFPDNMRSVGKDDVWEIIVRFNFTRDDALQTTTFGN